MFYSIVVFIGTSKVNITFSIITMRIEEMWSYILLANGLWIEEGFPKAIRHLHLALKNEFSE